MLEVRMLYSESIYCDEKKQNGPRPAQWYSIKVGRRAHLTKFSWVKPPEIAFECSYRSSHSPLHIEWTTQNSQLILEHNRNVLPFGVLSFRHDNGLYWRHCAINYLIEYNVHYAEKIKFTTLISDLDVLEDIPKHWAKYVEDAQKGMLSAKALFKACRKREKEQFGLISSKTMPKAVIKEIAALGRLRHYFENIPHNQHLAADYIEAFLNHGFEKLAKRHVISPEQAEQVQEMSYPRQLSVLQAFLKERVTIPRYIKNSQKEVIGAKLVVDSEVTMDYFHCFGVEYGGMKHLKNFKKWSEIDPGIEDVTKWFAQDKLERCSC